MQVMIKNSKKCNVWQRVNLRTEGDKKNAFDSPV